MFGRRPFRPAGPFGPTRFRRQIGLPADFNGEKVKAEYRDGILLLVVPKAEHAKARAIKIKVKK